MRRPVSLASRHTLAGGLDFCVAAQGHAARRRLSERYPSAPCDAEVSRVAAQGHAARRRLSERYQKRRNRSELELAAEVRDRRNEPCLERHFRLPAQQRSRPRDVRAPLLGIVLGKGPDRTDSAALAHDLPDGLCKLDQGHLPRVPQVDGESIALVLQGHQSGDKVVDVAEAAGLGPVAEDGEVFAAKGLRDEGGDHPAVIGAHSRAIGVEDARDADGKAMHPRVRGDQRLREPLGLVVARAGTDRVDVAEVLLALGVLQRIPVHLRRAGVDQRGAGFSGEIQRLAGAHGPDVQRLERQPRIVDRRRRRGQVEHRFRPAVDWNGPADVVLQELVAGIAAVAVGVVAAASEKAVDRDHFVTARQQPIDQMASDETGPAQDDRAHLFYPAVAVLEPDHVVQLRRGGFEDVAVRLRDHPVAEERGDVERVAGVEDGLLQLLTFPAGLEAHHAGQHMDGLVLAQVVLEAEGLTLVDVQDLADVAVGVRPDELVSPGLLDSDRLDRGHGQCVGITAAALRSSRSTSKRKRLAASLSGNAPTRTRYQVPLAPRFASITYGLRPAPRARASRRAASPRSREAPTWTAKLPSSRGGGVSCATVAGGTCTARSGGGTTVGCRAGEGTTDAVRTGSGLSTRSCAFSAGATLTLPSAGGAPREGTAGDSGLRARASRAARSPAAGAGACIEEILFPSRIPSENTPARSSSAQSASATTCRSSRESSILSRSRSTSRTGAGVPDRAGARYSSSAT